MSSRIDDYALIGDCETAALVSREGSIDWLCWPRFDLGACFAALLGEASNGAWRIAPAADAGADTETQVTRRYRDNTLIVETQFANSDGAVTLIDFMPPRIGLAASHVVRLVVGVRGTIADADGIDPAVRLRQLGALGFASRERRSTRDCWTGRGASPYAERA